MKHILFFLMIFCSLCSMAAEDDIWKTKCHDYGDDSIMISTLKIQNANWTISHQAFEDGNCKVAWLSHQLQYKVQTHGQKLDMTLVGASYTALTKETVEALNLVSYCGFADWKVDIKKDVIGKQCQDYLVPNKGQILYSIFLKSEAGADSNLKLGVSSENFDGSTTEKRHQNLSDVPYYISNLIPDN